MLIIMSYVTAWKMPHIDILTCLTLQEEKDLYVYCAPFHIFNDMSLQLHLSLHFPISTFSIKRLTKPFFQYFTTSNLRNFM